MYAAASGKAPVVELLLERGAQPGQRSAHGATALAVALEKGERSVIAKLRTATRETAPMLDF